MATMQAKSVKRREDLRLLTGKGITPPMPHRHEWRSRSSCARPMPMPVSSGSMRRRRGTCPGVIAVYTAADLTDVAPIAGGIGFPRPDGGPAPKTDRQLLAADRVRFVGEPVALVIAENAGGRTGGSRGDHRGVCGLPVVTEPAAAMAAGAPAVWDDVPDNIGFLWQRGDAEGTDTGTGRIGACHDA